MRSSLSHWRPQGWPGQEVHFAPAHLIAAVLAGIAMLLGQATPGQAETVRREASYAGPDTAMVSDPAAGDGESLAIRLVAVQARHALDLKFPRLTPGLYRVHLIARLHHAPADDLSDLQLGLHAQLGGEAVDLKGGWAQFNSDASRYTRLTLEHTVWQSASPRLSVHWAIHPHDGQSPKPIRAVQPPDIKAEQGGGGAGDLGDELSDLVSSSSAVALASLDGPALLIDAVEIELVAPAQAVTRVEPRKVHVAPGEANPVAITVANFTDAPVERVVQLRIMAGLDEMLHEAAQSVTIPGRSQASVTFDWTTGQRQFGHAAVATVLHDDTPLHQADEVFGVSANIWQLAIQGNGFILWFGREAQFEQHVAANRRKYVNVEEAFSWQPSSWDDFTPDEEVWWTGQNDYQNSLAGLHKWIGLSHAQGIKMISYIWPTASGPRGYDKARAHPEVIAHQQVGLSSEFYDVLDLELWDQTATDPRLWDLRSGIWNSLHYNRGMLPTMEVMIREVLASAERFGWDGVRFDKPPSWSAMSRQQASEEARALGVEALVDQLMPDTIDFTQDNLTGNAIGTRNVLYAAHQFRAAHPNFAISYNTDALQLDVEDPASGNGATFYRAMAQGGGQLQDEAIRHFARQNGRWDAFAQRVRDWVDPIRALGGHHCAVAMDDPDALAIAYQPIFVFAGGSHPYLDFGWAQPMPGPYNRFATRFSELLWHLDLRPVEPRELGITIEADSDLIWEPYVRRRTLADGRTQTVMHIITQPPTETINAAEQKPPRPWRDKLKVRIAEAGAAGPMTAWALSAEPRVRSQRIEVQPQADGVLLELADHRLWTVLVIEQGGAQ